MPTGMLRKMRSTLDQPVQYRIPVGDEELPLNERIGHPIRLEFTGNIACKNCGRATSKSFSQGYCYPCMRSLAACDLCIVKPETCHYHQGTCREPEWGQAHCFQPHIVYLSNTSGLKVGITRQPQVPTRWIDQGATQAIPMFEVSSRRQSGLVEMAFKSRIADKTNWRTMLRGGQDAIDLAEQSALLRESLAEDLSQIEARFDDGPITALDDARTVTIDYPVRQYPDKIISHNFDRNPVVEGVLEGIKGQYLLLDTGVINIRKFSAYEVSID